MNPFLLLVLMLVPNFAQHQNSARITVRNEEGHQPIAEAIVNIKDTDISAKTDDSGTIRLTGIPDGQQIIEIVSPGYDTKTVTLLFPSDNDREVVIFLRVNNELGEVTIASTTRISREIGAVPTRVEAISEEEIDEKLNMRPANVSMVLNESTGIKVQQTSATSNTQSIRIQGLDGRYTQILKDGFPAFGGFSGSLSVLDIPPLDLKQVEVIKGPSATFYGAGAIAGVVNFISKEPEGKRVTSMILNQTTALGTDFALFDSQQFQRIGYTVLGSFNYQREYDVDDDDFTELPRTYSFNVTPRLFFRLSDRTRLTVGNSTSYQRRLGGDVFVIRGDGDDFHQYFESDDSDRNITTLNFDRELDGGRKLLVRQSIAFFKRKSEIPDYVFKGTQTNSYTDASYFLPVHDHLLVIGLNASHDQFREKPAQQTAIRRDETRTTFGGYIQDSFALARKLSVEAGFRIDYLKDYGAFALPRVSMLYRFNGHLTSRFSVGLGYKSPSIFTEQAEMVLFKNVLPIGNRLKSERSRGGTFDLDYKTSIGEKFSFSINHMFYYTRIGSPLILEESGGNFFSFRNADRPIRSAGFETNARFVYGMVKLFAGYTFTDAKARYLTGDQTLPLVPRSRSNSALLFERESKFKAGVEAYYSSSQLLSTGFKTPSFWVYGIFGEKTFGKLSVFFNAENIGDTRQSRFSPVVFPPHQNPTFSEIYTHTEGRVFNGGIKVKF
jgi:outer membrane receptor for ferrienterochelin and colicins